MRETTPRRTLRLDHDILFWALVAVAMIALGIVLDVFLGSI